MSKLELVSGLVVKVMVPDSLTQPVRKSVTRIWNVISVGWNVVPLEIGFQPVVGIDIEVIVRCEWPVDS
jgi:hypothetical protein